MRTSDFIPCDICHEYGFRCNEHGCWKDWAVLDNSKRKPKYSQKRKLILGAVILVLMGTGMLIGGIHHAH